MWLTLPLSESQNVYWYWRRANGDSWSICTFLFSYCPYRGIYSCEFQHCLLKLYMDLCFAFVLWITVFLFSSHCQAQHSFGLLHISLINKWYTFTLDYHIWITFSHGVISSSAAAFCLLQTSPCSPFTRRADYPMEYKQALLFRRWEYILIIGSWSSFLLCDWLLGSSTGRLSLADGKLLLACDWILASSW